MNYWELEKEPWELDENKGPDCDGARWMTDMGRKQRLEKLLQLKGDEE